MANLLATGAQWLAGQLETHASVACILHREDGRTIEFDAVPGSTNWEGESYEGASFRFESRDYVVKASSLVLDGNPYRPSESDLIEVPSLAAKLQCYSPTDAGCWRYSDPSETSIRIHTRRLEPTP